PTAPRGSSRSSVLASRPLKFPSSTTPATPTHPLRSESLRPPRSPLFPYTTLFRSAPLHLVAALEGARETVNAGRVHRSRRDLLGAGWSLGVNCSDRVTSYSGVFLRDLGLLRVTAAAHQLPVDHRRPACGENSERRP